MYIAIVAITITASNNKLFNFLDNGLGLTMTLWLFQPASEV